MSPVAKAPRRYFIEFNAAMVLLIARMGLFVFAKNASC